MNHPIRLLVVGSSGSGKTTCVMNLLKRPQYNLIFDVIYICTGEGEISSPLFRTLPQAKKLTLKEEDLKKLIDDPQKGHNPRLRGCIVFDDPAGSSQFRHDGQFSRLWSGVGRHRNLSLICVCQKLTMYPPLLRSNCNYIILFDLGNMKQMKSFWEEYCFTTWAKFRTKYERFFTSNNHCFWFLRKEGSRWFAYSSIRPLIQYGPI